MIELRWLKAGDTPILQYRQQYDPTFRAGLPSLNSGMMTGYNPTLVWSAWRDVPTTVVDHANQK